MVPFSNDGHCDPWHYFGYFYLDDQFAAIGDSRTYSRLPSTIVGFGLTKLFHSVVADYLQYLVLLVAIAGSVFLLAQRLFGNFAAGIAALFLATSGIVIGVLSVTYTGPSLAWSTIAMSCALAAGTALNDRRRNLLVIAAGFFMATAIIGHLYTLTYNFVVPLYALSWSSEERRRPYTQLPRILGRLLIGVILAIVVLGFISKFVLHAEFTFFRHQFLEVFDVRVSEYRRPGWYLHGGKLAFVIFSVCLAATGIALRRRFPDPSKVLAVNVPLAVLLLAQLAYAALGGITLQYDYYYVWLLPPLALSLASVMAVLAAKDVRALPCIALFAVLSLASTLFGYSTIVDVTSAWPSTVVVIVTAGAVAVLARHRVRSTLSVALIGLGILGATIRPERMGVQVWSNTGDGSASYQRLRAGWDFLAHFHFQQTPLFWLAARGDLSDVIAFPRGFEYCHVDTALPDFVPAGDDNYDPRAEAFAAGRLVVAVVPDDRSFAEALATLRQRYGLQLEELARRRISGSGVAYTMIIGNLRPATPG
jgi:uncharacterized membrane protein